MKSYQVGCKVSSVGSFLSLPLLPLSLSSDIYRVIQNVDSDSVAVAVAVLVSVSQKRMMRLSWNGLWSLHGMVHIVVFSVEFIVFLALYYNYVSNLYY